MRRFLPAAWALLFAAGAAPPARAAGKTAAEFLQFGTGGPSMLSDAGGSVDSGPTALYWNPAGLAAVDKPEAYISHIDLPLTLRHDFLAVALPVGSAGTLAYGLQLLNQDPIPKRDNLGNRLGSFTPQDQAHALSWGVGRRGLRFGATVRYVSQRLDTESGSTVAMDLGAQGRLGPWLLGAAVSHLGPGLELGSRKSPLPLTGRAGVGRELLDGRLFLALDASKSRDREPAAHVGAAFKLVGPLTIGAGYTAREHDSDGPSGLAAGIGLRAGNWRADFVFRPFGALGDSFQLGLGVRFGSRGGAAPPP